MNHYDVLKNAINTISNKNGETMDCAIRALTAVTDYTYSYINNWMISNGYRKYRSGTKYEAELVFLREHKVQFERVNYTLLNAKTIKSFQRLKLSGKFLVLVRGHLMSVIDGHAIDWADMKQNRLIRVLEIF